MRILKAFLSLVLLALAVSAFSQPAQPVGSRTGYVYFPGMVRADTVVSFMLTDTASTKAAYPSLRMEGRLARQSGVTYIYHGTGFEPLTAGSGGGTADGNNYPTTLSFNSGTKTLTLGRSGLSSIAATIPYGDTAGISAKVKYTDTASMLGGYLRTSTAAGTYVPLTRTITINGTTYDLSANRSWTISTGSGSPDSSIFATHNYVAVNFSAIGHTHTFASLTSKPTTISGYGITDAFTQTAADALYSPLGHTHTFSSLTSKPTTLAGYGITDAAAATHTHAESDVTNLTTDLAAKSDKLGNVLAKTASYTLAAGDNNKVITFNSASGVTCTVPSGLGAGFNCLIVQLGAGQVTLSASSTTIQNRQSYTKTAGQYAILTLVSYTSNTFISSGDMQ